MAINLIKCYHRWDGWRRFLRLLREIVCNWIKCTVTSIKHWHNRRCVENPPGEGGWDAVFKAKERFLRLSEHLSRFRMKRYRCVANIKMWGSANCQDPEYNIKINNLRRGISCLPKSSNKYHFFFLMKLIASHVLRRTLWHCCSTMTMILSGLALGYASQDSIA